MKRAALTLAVTLATLVVPAPVSRAAGVSAEVTGFPGVTAALETEEEACPQTLPLTIRMPGEEDIRRRGQVQIRAMNWARRTCPDATAISLTGISGGTVVYRGIAQASNEWRLAEVALPSVVPSIPTNQAPQLPKIEPSSPAAISAINACDALAAHPEDPEAFSRGVADDTLDAKAAIIACEAAVRALPQTPRLHFQLARGYLKEARIADAVEGLLQAAEDGHGGALAYLADMQLDGVPGIEANPALARALYEKAAASGFGPAQKILGEFEDWTDAFSQADQEQPEAAPAAPPKAYLRPEIVQYILERRFDDIPYDEAYTKAYLVNVAEYIGFVCPEEFASDFPDEKLQTLKDAAEEDVFRVEGAAFEGKGPAMRGVFEWAYRASLPDYFSNSGTDLSFEIFSDASADVEALFQRHSCSSPSLKSFATNLRAFVRNDGARPRQDNAIFGECLTARGRNDARTWTLCGCAASSLPGALVTRADRKRLYEDFNGAMQSIVGRSGYNRQHFASCGRF